MLPPIVKTLEVPCDQETAFEIFVDEMDSWWPLARFSVSAIRGETPRALRVDARQGGTIVEVGHDGVEHLWGTITGYDPHAYLRMDFHIGEPAGAATLLELRFTVLGDARTRVELTQSGWEALGDWAEDLRGGYGGGWVVIFEQAYRAACGRNR